MNRSGKTKKAKTPVAVLAADERADLNAGAAAAMIASADPAVGIDTKKIEIYKKRFGISRGVFVLHKI